MIFTSQNRESLTLKATIEETPLGWRYLVEEGLQVCISTGVPFINGGTGDISGVLVFRITFYGTVTEPEDERVSLALKTLRELEHRTMWVCRSCGNELGIRWRAWGDLYTYCRACKERLLPGGVFIFNAWNRLLPG